MLSNNGIITAANQNNEKNSFIDQWKFYFQLLNNKKAAGIKILFSHQIDMFSLFPNECVMIMMRKYTSATGTELKGNQKHCFG